MSIATSAPDLPWSGNVPDVEFFDPATEAANIAEWLSRPVEQVEFEVDEWGYSFDGHPLWTRPGYQRVCELWFKVYSLGLTPSFSQAEH